MSKLYNFNVKMSIYNFDLYSLTENNKDDTICLVILLSFLFVELNWSSPQELQFFYLQKLHNDIQ